MRGALHRGFRVACWWLVAALLAAGSGAEIVVLVDGRFLKAVDYEVEGESVRIGLASGGQLVMPLLRVDRIVADELEDGDEEPAAIEVSPVYLGFAPEQEMPDIPFGELIYEAARRRNVNPRLVAAIIRAESAFDPAAVSRKGARGLMQLMPATGRRFGLVPDELFDEELNIDAGVTYLEELIERYAEDLPLVLAAYNAGEGAVERYKGVPPFRETREYIRRVYSFLGVEAVPDPAPDPAPAPGK
ncbi:MAG: lytic transglycosylase domain-containing protein [Acidobacteriota bacterium]|nr:lytic transglycosylase domain-containing protein [Acidobacteriota bacterium]MDH3524138.1 lytic transglycosylase domain-containing protein [Acidobacteriota bacterium]